MARAQFEQALPFADVSPMVRERLSFPERALIASVPLRRDDGTIQIFAGYRVQHSTVLGPTKGGIRYDPEVTLGECAALATWMPWKRALLRLPYGGAKGGIRCDVRTLSLKEVERLTRRFTSELLEVIGPHTDIPAPDMATNEQTMAWMMDTYAMQMGHVVPEVVTGKPIPIGGSVFRREATGAGVVMVTEQACERLGRPLAGQRCGVQGFGNVGGVAASELHDKGAKVVAVSDISGGVHHEAGLPVPELHAYVALNGSLAGYDGGERVTNEELLELPCDILVVAAREDQITGLNAARIQATLIVESENAQAAGECLANPEVRAVFVCEDDGQLVGVITRKTLVREVVAAGLHPAEVLLGSIAEPPLFTLDALLPLDEAFHSLEERDLERVPVVENGRLVGVLSRAVGQRRLAEDEPPALDPAPGPLVL